jgi:hypothetical protein
MWIDLIAKFGGYIAGGVMLLGSVVGLWFAAKKSGRDEAEKEIAQNNIEAVKDMKEKKDEVSGLGHADLDDRFNRWRMRDK